ncbi:hypothetical protein M3Y94_00257400 [Aphelenchoides besseyi]|nr:hypothetical protein M3Y94_00257400 [Aphelenchoides besseyi]KAI6236208.1 hypothetical protein M3Y95_00133200 [Aphelenchoides besseyi]
MLTDCLDVYPVVAELIENRMVVKCEVCNRVFANRGALRMHTVKIHRQMTNPADLPLHSWTQRLEQKQKQRFHCPASACSKNYNTKQKLVQHYQKVHCEKNYECGECQAKFALERDLRYHNNKLCVSLRESSEPTIKRPKRTESKSKNQSTQTAPFRLCVYVSRSVDSFQETSTQTNVPDTCIINYMNQQQQPMTCDFGGQYEQPAFSQLDQSLQYDANVSTYDQSTTYEPIYYNSPPERVDVNVGTVSDEFPRLSDYLTGSLDYADVPTQTPQQFDSECWDSNYVGPSPSQTHISTQTPFSYSEQTYDATQNFSSEFGSMTEPGYFR